MGQVYKGIHEKIALLARDYYGLEALVETGSYMGDTALWASKHFKRVVTIELSPGLFRETEEKLNLTKNVLAILGDSREWLGPVCRGRGSQPTLFWLDAHWTGEMEFTDPKGCPLIDEIKVINECFHGNHVIMVDDYSALQQYKWADDNEIVKALEDNKNQNRQVRTVDDIYFACQRLPEDFDSWKK